MIAAESLRAQPWEVGVTEAEWLNTPDAQRRLSAPFLQAAECRGWELRAAAVMLNHVHWVVGDR